MYGMYVPVMLLMFRYYMIVNKKGIFKRTVEIQN